MARRLDEILEMIRALSQEERVRLVSEVRQELDEEATRAEAAANPESIIGLFADDPDLIDEVCESAMQSRERDPLRLVNG